MVRVFEPERQNQSPDKDFLVHHLPRSLEPFLQLEQPYLQESSYLQNGSSSSGAARAARLVSGWRVWGCGDSSAPGRWLPAPLLGAFHYCRFL